RSKHEGWRNGAHCRDVASEAPRALEGGPGSASRAANLRRCERARLAPEEGAEEHESRVESRGGRSNLLKLRNRRCSHPMRRCSHRVGASLEIALASSPTAGVPMYERRPPMHTVLVGPCR